MSLLKHRQPQTASSSNSNFRIYDFLATHPIGVIATVDPNGLPHAAVVYFSVSEDFNITFATKRDTKKHDNLAHNKHLMLISYEASTQTTAQITGYAEDITGTPEADSVFRNMEETSLQTSDAGIPPLSKLEAGQYIAYRIKPVRIRMAVFVRPDPGGYDMFETIDFID